MLGAIERHRHKVSAGALAGLLVLASGVLLTSILAPRDPPPEALEWYRRGAMALRDGTYSAAANMLQKSVDLSPGFALAHARLAEAASELDDGARANREMLAALPKTSGKSPGGNASLYIDAIHLSLSGDLQGAAEAYRQLAANLAGVDKAAALVDLGRAYEKNRQVGKAVTAYREALSLDDQNAAAHLQYGILLGRRKDPEYAAELDRAFALYQALSNTEGQAEVLYQRGLLLSAVDPAAARAALERSREMARAIPSEQQDVAATLQLSTVAYVSGELERAEAMAAEGVERARRAGMNYLAARGLANLGDAQYLKRDYASAEASYNDSLTVARRHRLRRAEARALFGLANVHQTVGPEVAALDEARPALAYYREAGFQIETVLCLILLGRVNRDTGRPAEARTDFEAALVAARQVSDPARVHQAEQGMASVELAYGRWPDAIVKYELARHSAAEAPDPENVIRALNGMAGALWRLGRYQEAADALQEAERELKRLGSRNSLEEAILHRRAEIALSRGRSGEAAVLARRVLASSSFGQSARCLAAAAETRLGRSAAVRALCEEGLAALLRKGDQLAASEAQVWMSEILLQQEQHAAALDLLGKVATMAAATADRELEWRVWAMRAGVLRHLGDSEGAGLAARNAAQALARLEWDTKTLNGYLARPDIAPLKLQTYGGVR
jgi:tetratricopeptide (TPR) repeat protein